MRHVALSHRLGLVLLLVALAAQISHAAINPADLEALKQLFRGEGHFAKGPATAFEKSWKMLQEPRKNGNLEGMKKTRRRSTIVLLVRERKPFAWNA